MPKFQYRLADHLGNTVVFFEDKNNNGCITTEEEATSAADLEIIQRLLYYPFGMALEGLGAWNAQPRLKAGGQAWQQYRYNGKERDTLTGWYDYGARWAIMEIGGRFVSIDPLTDQMPGWSPYSYGFDNPAMFVDPDGRAPKDFVLLIAKNGAQGYGHMAAVIQDGDGNYYYVTQGAVENAGIVKMATSGVQGGMEVRQLLGVANMNEAVEKAAKEDTNNSEYTDFIQFTTNADTDQKIYKNIVKMANNINSKRVKYNVCSMNCTDAVERPIEDAIETRLPNNMVPNKNFEKVRSLQKTIQTNIDLKEKNSTIDFIPSGLDNVPAVTRPIIVPQIKN